MSYSVKQLLVQLRKAANGRRDGVTGVIEVTTKYVINLDTDEDVLGKQSEDELRQQIAAQIIEAQGNLGVANNLEVQGLIEVRDGGDQDQVIDTESAREVFAGHLAIDGVTLTADFDVPLGASVPEKDAAFLAALAGRARVDYVGIGVMATERVAQRKQPAGPTDCITRSPVAYWNSRHYRGDYASDKAFELEIDDQRTASGQVFLTLGACEGMVDDHLGAVMEVSRLPGDTEDLQSLRLTRGDSLVAIFYKQGDKVIVRPENGLHVEAVVLPDGEHAQAWT